MASLQNLETSEIWRPPCHRALGCSDRRLQTLGFLSTEQNAAGDPGFSLDAILLAGSYYFYCMDGSSEYGVCGSFLSWGFSHQEVPAGWQAMVSGILFREGSVPEYAARVRHGDIIRRASGSEDATDVAHLIKL